MIQTDTAVAISTPRGEGGIGVVRLSGPEAVAIGRQLFCSQHPLGQRVRRVEYGQVLAMGQPIDKGVAWVFAAPHSIPAKIPLKSAATVAWWFWNRWSQKRSGSVR